MTSGLPDSMSKVNSDAGGVALALRQAFDRLEIMRHFCLIHPDADFLALGFTQAQTTLIKSAMADADTIFQAATGNGTIPVAVNLMANLDQLAGDLLD